MKKELTNAGCFGFIVAVIAILTAGMFVRAWAISTLWAWFVMPAFGAAALSYQTGLGIGLLFFLIHPTSPYSSGPNENEGHGAWLWKMFLQAVIFPIIAVLCGRLYLWIF